MRKIIRNAVKCNKCNDVIESVHRHDFKWCSCGNVAVDGGLSYTKRCYKTHDYEELSEFEETEERRIIEVTEKELEIIQESMDFLYSSSIENAIIDYEVFGDLFDRLYYAKFTDLKKVEEQHK